jgi:m7GpppX diphosphatase
MAERATVASKLADLSKFVLGEVLRHDDSLTVLVGTFKGEDQEKKAVVKLTPVKPDALTLWPKLKLSLKSESGAEYAYYDAQTSLLSALFASSRESFSCEVIFPASQFQIDRCRPTRFVTFSETPAMYEEVTCPFIKERVGDGSSLSWLYNVLDGSKEQERLLADDPDPITGFIINIDTKWRSHPNPQEVPRETWKDCTNVDELYCLGIVRQRGIATVRDLRQEHVGMLKRMRK